MASPKVKLAALMAAICCLPLAGLGIRMWLESRKEVLPPVARAMMGAQGQVQMTSSLVSVAAPAAGPAPVDSMDLIRPVDAPPPPEPQEEVDTGPLAFPDEKARTSEEPHGAAPPAPPRVEDSDAPAPAPARAPKLKAMQGWKATDVGGGGSGRQVFYNGQQQAAPQTGPRPAAVVPSPSVETPAPRAAAAAPRPRSRGTPSASVTVKQMEVRVRVAPAAPSPLGTEYIVPQPVAQPAQPAQLLQPLPAAQLAAPDTRPQPNPESPRTSDGPCPRNGWWKNTSTGLCYYTKPSCDAADSRRGSCSQPNP